MSFYKNNNYPAFNYGHRVTFNNRFLNFTEDGGVTELSAEISVGSYTLGDYVNKVAQALNTAGGQEYTVILDRTTRQITISSTGSFNLLVATGTQVSFSGYPLLGFTGTDRENNNAYTSDTASGSQYICQTPLKNFSDFINNKQKTEATVRETSNGLVETISYGVVQRMKCDLPLITDIVPQRYIRETLNGVQEARSFLDYIIGKDPIEFIYNVEEPLNFVNCILDKTKGSASGTGYELREKIRQSLPNYYDVTGLVFRKIEGL